MIIRNPIASDLASPNHVADFLLTDSRRKGDVVTNLKLQKLLVPCSSMVLGAVRPSNFSRGF